MTRDEVWVVLQRHVLTVLSDLDENRLSPEQNLLDLGANSLDRLDIVTGVMDELNLTIPTVELIAAPDLGGLTDLFHSRFSQP